MLLLGGLVWGLILPAGAAACGESAAAQAGAGAHAKKFVWVELVGNLRVQLVRCPPGAVIEFRAEGKTYGLEFRDGELRARALGLDPKQTVVVSGWLDGKVTIAVTGLKPADPLGANTSIVPARKLVAKRKTPCTFVPNTRPL